MDVFRFSWFRVRLLNFVRLKAEEVQTFDFSGMLSNEFGQLSFNLTDDAIQLSDAGGEFGDAGKRVNQVELIAGVEQTLLVMLSVDIQQKWSEILQCRNSRRLIVDENAISSIAGNLAANDNFGAFRIKANALEAVCDVRLEDSFHDSARFSGSDSFRQRLRAGYQSESVDDNRLAGASLAGEQVKPVCEMDFEMIDQCEVADSKKTQHTPRCYTASGLIFQRPRG